MHKEFLPEDFDDELSHLIEECGEVLSAAGKTQRYGLDGMNPLLPKEEQETNRDWLLRGLEDLRLAIRSVQIEVIGQDLEQDLQKYKDEET